MVGTYQALLTRSMRWHIDQHRQGYITDKGLAKALLDLWESIEMCEMHDYANKSKSRLPPTNQGCQAKNDRLGSRRRHSDGSQ